MPDNILKVMGPMAAPACVSPGQIALLIRIWVHASGPAGVPSANEPAQPVWSDGTPLVGILRRIVDLGGGIPAETSTGLLRAHFVGDFAAAKTARHIQALVTGFAGATGQGGGPQILAVSIGIAPQGLAAPIETYLQQKAQPAQIVVASLRSVASALTATLPVRRLEGFSTDCELHELLWGHKEQAAAAAVQAHTRAALQRHEPALALMHSEPIRATALSQSLSTGLAHSRDQFADLTAMLRRWTLACRERLSSVPWRSLLGSKPLQLATLGVCVIAAAGLLLLHSHSPKVADTAGQPKAVAPPPNAGPITTTPASPRAANTSSPLTSERGGARKPLQPAPPKKTTANEAEEKPDKPARAGRGDLSPEQTRQVLNRGQAELDRGCYTRAIGYYRRVLDDDPRNAQANSGIEKARTRMRLSGGDSQAHCQ